MTFCFFLSARAPSNQPVAELNDASVASLHDLAGQTAGLTQLRLHTPTNAHDPMLDDGTGPALVLQALFESIHTLEAAVSKGGIFHELPDTDAYKLLAGADITQQAMLVRPYPVPEVRTELDQGKPHCTYLVGYEGPAQDTSAWLTHYLDGHPSLMAQLPGIRRIEIYSRLDWCGSLPWPRANTMQRNQVAFDSPKALTTALASPLRAQMREHFEHLPSFNGAVTHFPMRTTISSPSC